MKEYKRSRADLFEEIDKPVLRPLPLQRYENAIWSGDRVPLNYHLNVDGRFYSVPYQLVQVKVEIRLTRKIVEVFHRSERVTSHQRVEALGGHSTYEEHMPPAHKAQAEWTLERMLTWMEASCPNTRLAAETIRKRYDHPQQGLQACLGLYRLSCSHGAQRTEMACGLALVMSCVTVKAIRRLLANPPEAAAPAQEPPTPPVEHVNIRGSGYYSSTLEFGAGQDAVAGSISNSPANE
jgi:transposase